MSVLIYGILHNNILNNKRKGQCFNVTTKNKDKENNKNLERK
jgi:hypothetical protein